MAAAVASRALLAAPAAAVAKAQTKRAFFGNIAGLAPVARRSTPVVKSLAVKAETNYQVIEPLNGDPFVGGLETPVTSAPLVAWFLSNLPGYRTGVNPLLRGVETGPLRGTEVGQVAGTLGAAALVAILSMCLTVYGIASFKEGAPSTGSTLTLSGRTKEADKLQTADGWASFAGGFFFGGLSGVAWAYILLYVLDLPYPVNPLVFCVHCAPPPFLSHMHSRCLSPSVLPRAALLLLPAHLSSSLPASIFRRLTLPPPLPASTLFPADEPAAGVSVPSAPSTREGSSAATSLAAAGIDESTTTAGTESTGTAHSLDNGSNSSSITPVLGLGGERVRAVLPPRDLAREETRREETGRGGFVGRVDGEGGVTEEGVRVVDAAGEIGAGQGEEGEGREREEEGGGGRVGGVPGGRERGALEGSKKKTKAGREGRKRVKKRRVRRIRVRRKKRNRGRMQGVEVEGDERDERTGGGRAAAVSAEAENLDADVGEAVVVGGERQNEDGRSSGVGGGGGDADGERIDADEDEEGSSSVKKNMREIEEDEGKEENMGEEKEELKGEGKEDEEGEGREEGKVQGTDEGKEDETEERKEDKKEEGKDDEEREEGKGEVGEGREEVAARGDDRNDPAEEVEEEGETKHENNTTTRGEGASNEGEGGVDVDHDEEEDGK
ncbi:unnamed protein product [Closterium sp. Naga37s-1]|nr:unnamed protein product [Closterium sp. Naga37s-1]